MNRNPLMSKAYTTMHNNTQQYSTIKWCMHTPKLNNTTTSIDVVLLCLSAGFLR